jgi:biopolymer transport protein ExbD
MKRYLITGVLAVVLLALGVVHIISRRHSHGLSVEVVVHCIEPDEHLRMIRLQVNGDGSFAINEREPITAERLSPRLAEIYKSRSERLLFFDAADSGTYQQAISAIDVAQTAVPGLRVMLITPSTREDCAREGIIRRIPAPE